MLALCDFDVLHDVNLLVKTPKGKYLLYIESKERITNETPYRQTLAQVVLTHKTQKQMVTQLALIYQDAEQDDGLNLILFSKKGSTP